MTKRVYMTFGPGEWRPVKELLKRRHPYLPTSTAAKLILMELAENKGPVASSATASTSEVLQAPDSTSEHLTAPCPSPAGAPGHSPEKKEEKKKKKKEQEVARLAPLDVSGDVIGYLNEQAGTSCRPSAEAHRRLIQARLNDGATVEDLKTVIRKMCAQWKGTDMQHNLKPSCLFRGSNFDGYLGQLEGRSGQQSFNPDNQGNQQDYTKGVDENGRW